MLFRSVKHARETSAYVDVEYVYNQNNAVRYRIKSENGCVLAQKQVYCLNPDATIAILNNLENNPYEYLGWYENEDGVSVYQNKEEALKNISLP